MESLQQISGPINDNLDTDADDTDLMPWDDQEFDSAADWPAWTDGERWGCELETEEDRADRAFWAMACQIHGLPDRSDAGADRAFFEDEADDWLGRGAPADEFGFEAFVGSVLRSQAEAMGFHRAARAADLALVRRVDLDKVWVPGTGARRSALAAALDVEASYYLHLDTDAGRLAAWALEHKADLAEDMGSQNVADWVADEGAWAAAMADAVMEG